jgi:hypothetical protein
MRAQLVQNHVAQARDEVQADVAGVAVPGVLVDLKIL